jgi:hypothetical protein
VTVCGFGIVCLVVIGGGCWRDDVGVCVVMNFGRDPVAMVTKLKIIKGLPLFRG